MLKEVAVDQGAAPFRQLMQLLEIVSSPRSILVDLKAVRAPRSLCVTCRQLQPEKDHQSSLCSDRVEEQQPNDDEQKESDDQLVPW